MATKIYERVDYRWMRNGHPTLLAHGWMPETGFIAARYEKYCQLAAHVPLRHRVTYSVTAARILVRVERDL